MENHAARIWRSAKDLFYYDRIGKTINKEIRKADVKLGFFVMLGAAFLAASISSLMMLETFYFVNYMIELAAETTAAAPPPVSMDDLIPFILFQFIFNVPFIVLLTLGYEGICYWAMKLTGGTGTFAKQFYLSSIISFSIAASMSLGLLTPLPCLNIVALFSLLILILYFILIVNVKAYGVVHDISFLHAFAVVVVLSIPRFWLMVVVPDLAAGFFGLPQNVDLSGV